MKINLFSSVSKTPSINKSGFLLVLRQLFPVFVLAAFLPVGLMMVLSSQNFTWFSRAEKSLEINLWLEPQELVVYSGQPVTLRVMAEFIDEKRLILSLSAQAEVNPQNPIVPQIISYTKPFRGRLQIGTISFTPSFLGNYHISLPKNEVIINSAEPVSVVTAASDIYVEETMPL